MNRVRIYSPLIPANIHDKESADEKILQLETCTDEKHEEKLENAEISLRSHSLHEGSRHRLQGSGCLSNLRSRQISFTFLRRKRITAISVDGWMIRFESSALRPRRGRARALRKCLWRLIVETDHCFCSSLRANSRWTCSCCFGVCGALDLDTTRHLWQTETRLIASWEDKL